MSIVKIHLYRSQTQKQQKYLLTYLPQIHTSIAHFLEFAIKALDIHHCTPDQLIVQNDGYILPHCLNATVIKEMQLLTIKVRSCKKIPAFWTAQKLDQPVTEKQHQFALDILNHIDQEVEESQSTPKFSEDGLHQLNISRKNSKQSKPHKKIQKQLKSQPSKKKKKVVQEPEQSSESEQQEIKKPTSKKSPKVPKLKTKKKIASFAQPSSQSSEQEEKKQSQSESSEESSEEELPRISKSKKVQLQEKVESKKIEHKKPEKIIEKAKSDQSSPKERQQPKHQKSYTQSKPHIQKQIQSKPRFQKQIQKVQKVQNKVEKQVVSKPFPQKVTYQQRKKIIEADDIESSDSSSEEQVPVKKVVPQNKNPKTVQPAQGRMLPPALRNKNQKSPISNQLHPIVSSFKQQQQQKWVPITKEIIEKYKKVHQVNFPAETPFSQPNNLIRFKEVELDEERFVPKTSEWIEATVERVESDGKLKLIKVTQFGKEYRDRYDTYEHNMVEFQVKKDILTKQQRQVVLEGQQNQKPQQIVVQNNSNGNAPITQTQQVQKQSDQRNSIQKFICGQVNFYFSDKNYNFDLFMQMHANKHPQKYIPIRFMLNFPKIKKALKDQHKLFQYLAEDEKRSERNFEIDQERRLVRKRNIIKIQQQTPKDTVLEQKALQQGKIQQQQPVLPEN